MKGSWKSILPNIIYHITCILNSILLCPFKSSQYFFPFLLPLIFFSNYKEYLFSLSLSPPTLPPLFSSPPVFLSPSPCCFFEMEVSLCYPGWLWTPGFKWSSCFSPPRSQAYGLTPLHPAVFFFILFIFVVVIFICVCDWGLNPGAFYH